MTATFVMRCADATCTVERDLKTESWGGQPHGRASTVSLLLRSGLVLVHSLDNRVPPWVVILFTCASAVYLLHSMLSYLPYYHAKLNEVHTAAAMLFCWCAFCFAMLEMRKLPEVLVFNSPKFVRLLLIVVAVVLFPVQRGGIHVRPGRSQHDGFWIVFVPQEHCKEA
jgi:hypothetical protein